MSVLNTNILNQSNLHMMDPEKIQGYIKILDENRRKFHKSGNYTKAETAKKKIIQLKRAENEKVEEEIKQSFFNQKSHIEEDQNNELEVAKEELKTKQDSIKKKYKDLQTKLHEKFKKQLEDHVKNFEKNYPKPVFSNAKEVAELKKTLTALVKERNYLKADEVQKKIKAIEDKKFEKTDDYFKTKNDKLKKEILRIKKKHEKEFKMYQEKMNFEINHVENEYIDETNQINLKFKNKKGEIDFKQKKDLRLAKRPERKLSQSLIKTSSQLKKSFLISINNSRISLNNSIDNYNINV